MEDPRLRGQLRTLQNACREVLRGVFAQHQAADRLLAAFFRDNPRCGSRDRALVNEGVCSLLRTWGFWRNCLPSDRREEIEAGTIHLSDRELAGLLFASFYTMGFEGELLPAIAQEVRLTLPPRTGTPLERAHRAAQQFGTAYHPEAEDLLPKALRHLLPGNHQERTGVAESLLRRPPLWIRIQGEEDALQHDLAGIPGLVQRRPERPAGALALSGANVRFSALPSWQKGAFEVQDLASQCIGLVCAPRPGERWYDPCAGAGGKTLQLAALMKRRGEVCAGDVRAWKLEELRRRARRAGFPNIRTRAHDGGPWRGRHPCDGVLVDAPCSGSGVWRRNPGGQWALSADEVAEYAARQFDILKGNSAAVRPGGVLVYATCSLFTAENEEVVQRFLAEMPEFKLDPFLHPVTGACMPGMLRVDGTLFDCDFLFAARFRRFGA